MRAVWVSGVLAAALIIGVFVYLLPLKPGVIALQFAWQPQTFGGIIHLWSEADLARYRSHLPVDFIVLLAYAAFGWLLATRTRLFASLSSRLQRLACLCLPLAAALDALENAFHAWLTEMPRFDADIIYQLSALCAVLKWGLILGFGMLLMWAIARVVADD